MILSGRYGQVLYTPPSGGAEAEIASINAWKLDRTTDYEDVSCFNDQNKVYVPGLPDVSGTLGGFWNSSELALWKAARNTTPGTLKLVPNRNEPTFFWSGPAYVDASIDCTLAAPKVSGNFKGAGVWTDPGAGPAATGATAGIPGSYTPAGAELPANLAALTGVIASPLTAWTTGQYVPLGDGSKAHWSSTAWVTGVA